jgi:geranylgeranyl pyrophosphate synthase
VGLIAALYFPCIVREELSRIVPTDFLFELSSAYKQLLIGQVRENMLRNKREASFSDYRDIAWLKSGALVEYALRAGQRLATDIWQSEDEPRYAAWHFALGYQMLDDLTEIVEHDPDSSELPVDIRAGIKAAPYFFLDKHPDNSSLSPVIDQYGLGKASDDMLRELFLAMRHPAVVNALSYTASEHVLRSSAILREWLPSSRSTEALINFSISIWTKVASQAEAKWGVRLAVDERFDDRSQEC